MPPSHPPQSDAPPARPPRRARSRAALAGAGLAALTTLAVATPVAAAPAPAAAAPTTSVPAEAAAGWLARQLVDGAYLETVVGGTPYPDAGLTLDAALAFAAAGVAGDGATGALTWLGQPANLATYVGDGTAESYAGALAKLSLVAQVEGQDPTAFGAADVDLLARLRALLAASGRFADKSQYGDFSNAFGQSYAVLALDRAGGAPAAAVTYLAGSECGTGGFPLDFEKATCVPDTDATALVAQALAAAGADEAAGRAIAWLLDQQRPDGSFGGGTSTEGANANSTGVAAQALAAAGEEAAAARAAAFLKTLQSGCTAPAAQRGAVRYQAGAFDETTAPRATAQAVLGLAGVGLAELDGTAGAAAVPVLACAPAPTTTAAPTTAPPTSTPTTAPTTAPTRSPSPTPAPVQPGTPPAYGGELPATGADPVPVAWLGVALVGSGAMLALVARRRRPSSP